jgi:hypothetical protein
MAVQMKATSAVNLTDVIYGTNSIARKLVEAVIQQQADSTLEMLIDTQEGELTRREIVDHLAAVKESAADLIEDMLAGLRHSLGEELNKAKISPVVTSIQYNPLDGMVDDANVVMNVQFPD